jgi:hypothetical protein
MYKLSKFYKIQYDIPETEPVPEYEDKTITKYPGVRIIPETAQIGKKYIFVFGTKPDIYEGIIRNLYKKGDMYTTIVDVTHKVYTGSSMQLYLTCNVSNNKKIRNNTNMTMIAPFENPIGDSEKMRKMVDYYGHEKAIEDALVFRKPDDTFERRHDLLMLYYELYDKFED